MQELDDNALLREFVAGGSGESLAALANSDQSGNDAPMPASSIEFNPPDLRLKWKW